MRLNSLISEAEQKLGATTRAQLLLTLATAVLPALHHATLSVAKESISLASQWKPSGLLKAENLYSFANISEIKGLAFQEVTATNPEELAAIIAITMAYYYTVWCAYIAEGQLIVPEDVEAVSVEAFQGAFRYAIDSSTVRESELCDLLEKYLAGNHA